MKLSRRGKRTKHALRARHTKRAGKHLGYKSKSKKFSGSKRYHRGNKRTYKRGKRFHRGGVSNTFDNVMFLVSKKGLYLEEEQFFIMTIELDDKNIATVKLVRKDKENITFKITGNIIDVRALLVTPNTPRDVGGNNVDFKKLDDDKKTGIYDFYRDGQNDKTFEAIVNQLDSLYQTNYDILMPQHHYASSVKSS